MPVILVGALVLGIAGVGCGSDPRSAATVNVSSPPTSTGPTGPTGSTVADDAAAVAALDGSAVFSIRDGELVRIDPDTNDVMSSWDLPRDMASISAVAPEGRWVALTDRPAGYDASQLRTATELVVFDPATGSETHRIPFTGDVRPEAFSVNGTLVFALDHRGDHYRVQTIILATGERYDTSNRDKTLEREDMHGTTVRGVLNGDRTVLATLYRDPGNDKDPAFVHILDLVHGWAYCADLPRPFGEGPGTDRIELTTADTVVVTSADASRIAEIHIDEVLTPSATPITVKYRDGAVE